MRTIILGILLAFSFAAVAADKLPPRNQTEKRHFAKAHPCPATQLPVPSCHGYVIDHVVPICMSGSDTADNMQWQLIDVSRLKDRIEKASCLCIKRHGAAACPKIDWKPAP
jgi:hypothetical protein